jgi:hypothetical protein
MDEGIAVALPDVLTARKHLLQYNIAMYSFSETHTTVSVRNECG